MTREEAFKDINNTQEYYVDELVDALSDANRSCFKEQNFTSDTGTGKTRMIAMLVNKMPQKFFVITTLSRGQLVKQVRENLSKLINGNNYVIYGLCDFTANTKLQAEEILSNLPKDKEIIWVRDEGHIRTNRWQEIINNRCEKIVNFSATNKEEGIRCNFAHTMMLRTVNQQEGTPAEALDKLVEIKQIHKNVKNYNPCAIMRSLDDKTTLDIIKECENRNLKYINITEENFDMSELCEDNNEYDVIINKFKIVEGVDLRRAHVIYMTNEPSNIGTTIQIIGRARRNALLYRDDIDILAPENEELLDATRQCFVFYNIKNMKIDVDMDGNLCMAFCNIISCEKLKVGSIIKVKNGVMDNGLKIIELENQTGTFIVSKDDVTGFNVVLPESEFYEKKEVEVKTLLYGYTKEEIYTNFKQDEYFCIPTIQEVKVRIDSLPIFDYELKTYEKKEKYCVDILYSPKEYNIDAIWQDKYHANPYIYYFEKPIKKKHSFTTLEARKKFISNLPVPKKINYIINKKWMVKWEAAINLRSFSIPSHKAFCEQGSEKLNFSRISDKNDFITVECCFYKRMSVEEINDYFNLHCFCSYKKIINDKEIAIIGADSMKPINSTTGIQWIEDRAVTSKIIEHSKFNIFIQNKYAKQLQDIMPKLYNGKNQFGFDKKCNSCLGYCAEYYGKYLIYGDAFLGNYIEKVKAEYRIGVGNPNVAIVRACMLMYRDQMKLIYGEGVGRLIPTMSIDSLKGKEHKTFIDTVIKLGKNIAEFVKKEFNILDCLNVDKQYDPNLSVNHIGALADFIDKDKIIDVKCTSSITLNNIKQVLAYHYLSTKRSDLEIKEVIVYDAVNDECVKVKL